MVLPSPRIVSEVGGRWCDSEGELHDLEHADLQGQTCDVGNCDRVAVWAVCTVLEIPRFLGTARVPGLRVAALRPVCDSETCLFLSNLGGDAMRARIG